MPFIQESMNWRLNFLNLPQGPTMTGPLRLRSRAFPLMEEPVCWAPFASAPSLSDRGGIELSTCERRRSPKKVPRDDYETKRVRIASMPSESLVDISGRLTLLEQPPRPSTAQKQALYLKLTVHAVTIQRHLCALSCRWSRSEHLGAGHDEALGLRSTWQTSTDPDCLFRGLDILGHSHLHDTTGGKHTIPS